MVPIVDPTYKDPANAPEGLLAKYESRNYADRRSDLFHCDKAIVFALARIAYKDLPDKSHFVRKKGKRLQSRQEAYIACKGQFIGINTT